MLFNLKHFETGIVLKCNVELLELVEGSSVVLCSALREDVDLEICLRNFLLISQLVRLTKRLTFALELSKLLR